MSVLGRIQMMVARGVLSLVDDAVKAQALQIELLEDETHDGVERFQEYGFTSHPHPGAEVAVVFAGGLRSHGLVVAVEDRRYRLKALEQGEVALYDDQGQVVHLKRDQILLKSPFKVAIEAPEALVTADQVTVDSGSVDLGGTGGPAVARVGDSVAGGVITSGSASVRAA